MNLKKATLLAIIGLCYTFALRTIATFLPEMFRDLTVVRINETLLLLSSLTAIIFFVYFLMDYVKENQVGLKNATVLAIIGASLMSLLLLKGLLMIFNEYALGSWIRPGFIEPIISWVSSLSIFIFFFVFYQQTFQEGLTKLRQATLWATVGSLVGVLSRTLIFILYLSSGQIRWFSDLALKSRFVFLIFLPIFAFNFVTVLYFFLVFYREQE